MHFCLSAGFRQSKIHYTSFPVASLQQVRNKSLTSWRRQTPWCLLCRVVSQIPLQRHVEVVNKQAIQMQCDLNIQAAGRTRRERPEVGLGHQKNETGQWQPVCATPRLLNRSQPGPINFGILLSHIACDITISLCPILYWVCCSNSATGDWLLKQTNHLLFTLRYITRNLEWKNA